MKPSNGTLVWNVGSSTIKGVLFVGTKQIFRWHADLTQKKLFFSHTKKPISVHDVAEVIRSIQDHLPTAVTVVHHIHRIVYAGPNLWKPVRVRSSVLHTIEKYRNRDPLHLPAALEVYRLVQSIWPKTDGWFVFDSGMYHSLPPMVREYALPRWVVDRYHIQRLGFHGISHWWAASSSARRLKAHLSSWNGVTVHLGSGSSITAWRQGQTIDTSMGFSPLSGPMMATRSGDLDPFVPMFLVREAGMTPRRVEALLTNESGFRGVTGSPDIRDALSALGHHQKDWPTPNRVHRADAELAVRMFTYEVAKYIGSYLALLPAASPIVFTGAIGQNKIIQRRILRWLHQPSKRLVQTVTADEEQAMVEILGDMIY